MGRCTDSFIDEKGVFFPGVGVGIKQVGEKTRPPFYKIILGRVFSEERGFYKRIEVNSRSATIHMFGTFRGAQIGRGIWGAPPPTIQTTF